MANKMGFTITLSSRYEGWWRYNAALMCGAFDAAGERIGFASARSDVAEVGANLALKPDGVEEGRLVELTAPACDHLMLYVYIVPHTLPAGNDIDAERPFEAELSVSFGGKHLCSEKLPVNRWAGISLERRIACPQRTVQSSLTAGSADK